MTSFIKSGLMVSASVLLGPHVKSSTDWKAKKLGLKVA